MRSNAAPDLMITPNLLAAPIAETTVIGTEIASAHGEAATSTTSARSIHSPESPKIEPIRATRAARMRTPGTSGRARRSAIRARSPFSVCACSTSSTTVVKELSVPAAVASTSRTPEVLIEPANTASPGPTSTGMDSPVIAETSRLLCPTRTIPSVARRSPAARRSTSPRSRDSTGTVRAAPVAPRMVALVGIRANRARKPERALSIARSSSASTMEYKKARAAASSTNPSATAPAALIVISSPILNRPRTSRPRTAPGTNCEAPRRRAVQNSHAAAASAPGPSANHSRIKPSSRVRPENTGMRTAPLRNHEADSSGLVTGPAGSQPHADVVTADPLPNCSNPRPDTACPDRVRSRQRPKSSRPRRSTRVPDGRRRSRTDSVDPQVQPRRSRNP